MKKGLIYVLITAVTFATLEPVSKLIANQVNPYAVTFIRFLISCLMLMPYALYNIKKTNTKLELKDHISFCGLGFLFVCVSMVLLQVAVLESSSPAVIAIIFSANSVITIIISTLVFREKVTIKKVVSLLLCIIGILICSWKSFRQSMEIMPVILAFFAALSFSVYTILSKKAMKRIKGSIVTGFSFFYGSLMLLVILLIMKVPVVSGISLNNIPVLLYLGIVVTGIGYWSFFVALEKTNPATASTAFLIKPVLAPFASYIIIGEAFSAEVFIALLLVIIGSYVINN